MRLTHLRNIEKFLKSEFPEDPDEYHGENILWVPQESRWSRIEHVAKIP